MLRMNLRIMRVTFSHKKSQRIRSWRPMSNHPKTRHRTFRTVEDYFDNFEGDLKRIIVIPTRTFGAICITSFVFGE